MEKRKPIYPVLDEGTYAEDVERGIVEAEKKAAEIERQAKRDRDMALIGDMAHLVSQGAAMHGGAWKIGQTQNEGAKGNERLKVLREKNAAQAAAFARERAALMETKRKEQNAQKLAQYNAEVEAQKREENERHNKALEDIRREEQVRLWKQYGNRGGGKEKNIRYLGDWAFDIDDDVDIDEAYYKLTRDNPHYKVTEADGLGGEILAKNPTTAQKRAKLIEAGVTREPAKKANGDNTPPSRRKDNSNTPPSRR